MCAHFICEDTNVVIAQNVIVPVGVLYKLYIETFHVIAILWISYQQYVAFYMYAK